MSAPTDPRSDWWASLKWWQKVMVVIVAAAIVVIVCFTLGTPPVPADA